MAPYKNVNDGAQTTYSLSRDIFQKYNDDANSIFSRINKLSPPNKCLVRQSNQIPEKSPQTQNQQENGSCFIPNNSETVSPQAPPAPPAPPPPPPPVLNGGSIPTIRLRSEIPDPPAKIQSAMTKDKKPFTYTPGGIDLSEIKSPRMQRRIVRNAQEPEDRILPTAAPINTNSLPPSTVAAMMPQMAIPVFPQNQVDLKNIHQKHNVHAPPPPPLPASAIVHNTSNSTSTACHADKILNPPSVPQKQCSNFKTGAQIGSLYIPPVTNNDSVKSKQSSSPPAFPTLREAPTPWLQKRQQSPPENVPFWANRNNQSNNNGESKEMQHERKPLIIQVNKKSESEQQISNGNSHIIPIQIEGSTKTTNQRSNRPNPQRWGNNRENNPTVETNANNNRITQKQNSEIDSKPIQSRSFKVIQKITGSEDDSTDFNSNVPHNTEGVPLNQLRKLHLNDDDKGLMNKVKAQVDEDTFLHMETDPRYRGSAIPSKAFKILQNMTDSGQVKSNNVLVIPITSITSTNQTPTHSTSNTAVIHPQIDNKSIVGKNTAENETSRKYIPPSERQAEQDLRKYMGSSIPSRSFKILQAMTATQDTTENVSENTDKHNEDVKISYNVHSNLNPWSSPPRTANDVFLLWQNYLDLYNLVFQHSPNVNFPPLTAYNLPPEDLDFKNSNNIKIIITDDNDKSSLENGNSISDLRSENRYFKIKAERFEKRGTGKKNELFLDSKNDTSLTVHLPFQKKRSAFHEEVTLIKTFAVSNANDNDCTQNFLTESNNSVYASITLKSTNKNDKNIRAFTSDSLVNDSSSYVISDANDSCRSLLKYKSDHDTCSENGSLTAYSDSDSSVDFWKEIVDDDDELFFKTNRTGPNRGNQEQYIDESISTEIQEIVNSVKEFRNHTPVNDTCDSSCNSYNNKSSNSHRSNNSNSCICSPNDERYSFNSESSESSESEEEKIKTNIIQTEDDTNSTSNSETSKSNDETDSYNMFEFSISEECRNSLRVEGIEVKGNSENIFDESKDKSKCPKIQENYEISVTKTNINYNAADLEDEDSGMISDNGRCISEKETECSELKKLNKYQKTATHSRLYKLLLQEAEERQSTEKEVAKENESTKRKGLLTLPLQANNVGFAGSVSSSSGINSPMSPIVTDKFDNESAQNLLNWNKNDDCWNLSSEKLTESVIKSLQLETSGKSRANSPYYFKDVNSKEKTQSDQAQRIELNNRNSYESEDNSLYYPSFDIIPSRAFKNLQSGRTTPLNWPKCPLLSKQESSNPVEKFNKTQDGSYK